MLLYLGTLINLLLQVHDRHTSRVLTCFEINQHPSHFQNILANILELVYRRRTNGKWAT